MTTNKECTENLESGLGGLQNDFTRIEGGLNDKLHQLEAAINRMSDLMLSNRATPNPSLSESTTQLASPVIQSDGNALQSHSEGGRQLFFFELAKLEFPRFSGGDPTEWFAKFLGRPTKVNVEVVSGRTLGRFGPARFGPTDCKDFDKALSKIKQMGSLRECQQEFERLGNRVHGWSQKALIGTFIGGLKLKVAEGIRMFKPKTLK
ncbi:hypothetical protein GH714_014508 [Hevea brasiliensis]|uniref:Retrotransposon gag domain-containing protein n=1 Tax=Hevea brasiliensis TaxID=3981 RepID=A0A6A6MDV5_HEVBR|nr:hypothetical protein GH714_014508 [Hevea brasiliensis]